MSKEPVAINTLPPERLTEKPIKAACETCGGTGLVALFYRGKAVVQSCECRALGKAVR